jgi:putative addiction module component (TIGR02574 family)
MLLKFRPRFRKVSSMKLADLPEVETLSPDEKLALVDELWASIGTAIEHLEVTEEEKRLLDERWERYLLDPSAALTEQEFRSRIETLRR